MGDTGKQNVSFTLVLDTTNLDSRDSVSFSASGSVMQTSEANGETVIVYYTLEGTLNNNWFAIYVDGSENTKRLRQGQDHIATL